MFERGSCSIEVHNQVFSQAEKNFEGWEEKFDRYALRNWNNQLLLLSRDYEPITDPRFGLNVSRTRRVRFDLLAKGSDQDTDGVILVGVVSSPDLLKKK
jgi:hypothetical protein